MRKKYAWSIVILSVITVLVMFLLTKWVYATPVLLISYLTVSFLIYLNFHKRMKVYKAAQNWNQERKQKVVIDTSFRKQKLTVSNGWFLISFLIALATLTVSLVMYDKIPARIPMHYDFQGHVNRWANKSYRSIMILPFTQMYLVGLFVFINFMIGRAKATIDPDSPKASVQKNVIFRKRYSIFTVVIGTLSVVMMAIPQMDFIFDIPNGLMQVMTMGFPILVIVAAIALAFTTGQGGSRIKTSDVQDSRFVSRDDDRYWKWGVFYFNREDPAFFVEKRFGVGWTTNFANVWSWVFLIGIIAIAVLIPLLLSL